MNYYEVKKRIVAAQIILSDDMLSRDKFEALRTLLKGINPKVDSLLEKGSEEFLRVERYYKGAAIELAIEKLPEVTEEQKRTKKALFLFINTWNQLQGEVKRVEQEISAMHSSKTDTQKKLHIGKIINFARGPFGIITIIAVVVVVVLQATSVAITFKNFGCGTIQPPTILPIPLPGLSLPKDPIPNNGVANITMFPLTLTIDGTQQGTLSLLAFGASYPFSVSSNVSDVTFDGQSLLRRQTTLRLSTQKQHSLILRCL